MGTGIIGGIPLVFRFGSKWRYSEMDAKRDKERFIKHAPKDFFDFYNEELHDLEISKTKSLPVTYYVIKPEILLPNFKEYFYKFNELIGESDYPDDYEKFNDEYDVVVKSNDLKKFIEYFTDSRGEPYMFSEVEMSYVDVSKNLLIYRGSYKAILEEWTSLQHMERLLWAAMDHPLAKVTRIGMSL
ncbi:MAG: hypothetical protein LBP72_01565 [Dysgonamonadaceae bacterium]|jgi:hypothetical protein|nr:hypothetical protein [Dysgonamonadaceae bacterium]